MWTGFPTTFIYLFCVLFCFGVFVFLIGPLYTTDAGFDVMATLLPCIPKNWDMHHYTAYILKEIFSKEIFWKNMTFHSTTEEGLSLEKQLCPLANGSISEGRTGYYLW